MQQSRRRVVLYCQVYLGLSHHLQSRAFWARVCLILDCCVSFGDRLSVAFCPLMPYAGEETCPYLSLCGTAHTRSTWSTRCKHHASLCSTTSHEPGQIYRGEKKCGRLSLVLMLVQDCWYHRLVELYVTEIWVLLSRPYCVVLPRPRETRGI